jgi:hypothetical protein
MAPSGIAPSRRFEAIACGRVLEGVEAELVQERRQRNLRVVRHGRPQRQRPVRGQLAHQPVGQWLDGIVLVLFRVSLAADRDDGALGSERARSGGAVRGAGDSLDGEGGQRYGAGGDAGGGLGWRDEAGILRVHWVGCGRLLRSSRCSPRCRASETRRSGSTANFGYRIGGSGPRSGSSKSQVSQAQGYFAGHPEPQCRFAVLH